MNKRFFHCVTAYTDVKSLLLLLIAMLGVYDCFAQLKADAGADTVWCISSPNGMDLGPRIGGTPAAQNGTPPYTYEWYSLNIGHAALDTFINPRPLLVANPANGYYMGIDTAHFVLRVTDATSAVAYDSVNVILSQWVCPMASCSLAKQAPDTISMQWQYSCQSKFPPYLPFTFKYWTPSPYLSDSTNEHARCWAPIPTEYTAVSVDGLGCISLKRCEVWFPSTTIESELKAGEKAIIAPNPLAYESLLKCGSDWIGGTLTITAADGKVVSRITITMSKTHLPGIASLRPGMYFYCITSASGKVQTGKLVKE